MVPEFVGTMLYLVIKPFSLFKLSCMAGVRATSIVINTWVEVLCTFIYLNVSIFWRFVLGSLSLITLPARALAALYREKQLQAQLNELQDRVESLVWDRKELQKHIRVANKEQEMLEMMLGELEGEHDEAIHKIKLMETEVRFYCFCDVDLDHVFQMSFCVGVSLGANSFIAKLQYLKDENHRLKEVHGKSQWDTDIQDGASYGYGQKHNKDGMSPWKSDRHKFTDILMHRDAFDDVSKGKFNAHDSVKNGSASVVHQLMNGSVICGQQREVAISQSLFSAMLSLLVGMVVWEAQDPCMPLVTALLMVVGMSLKSVVQFYSTIKNKPASDAVALLSLNWFILGTLAYPTLPKIARLSARFFTKSFAGFSILAS